MFKETYVRDDKYTVYMGFDSEVLDGSRIPTIIHRILNNEDIIKNITVQIGVSKKNPKDKSFNRKIGNKVAKDKAKSVELSLKDFSSNSNYARMSFVSDSTHLCLKWGVNYKDGKYHISGSPKILRYFDGSVTVYNY